MAVSKRKRSTRRRGTTTHGWGSMKKRRGAGNRGGRGRAGSGKRGDQKKPSLWKNRKYFGKYGFKSKSRAPKIKPINIKTIDDKTESLVKKGLIKFENGSYVINLSDLGYNKLLSTGKVTKKFTITTDYATEKAVEKIKKAGGDVNVLATKKAKTAEKTEEKPAEEQ
jgi:large subunit ribosomal protein L15